ncbi:heme NO-binding domain-containing protein [Alteromonas sp. ASW11-130]|uniref:heme NO-binding domain-containing protein n=1 Tax=Alteromonas sp. ASW11-130 TaxID=3015775 RepID=UPI002241DAFA|nr:heme NO-binding domain-containing protein [Alteromonas sp. ASW11-130]MCW8090957.1 heme NO-binding domain-containing protein [Alteromonas sp. ASW11-130]
MLGIVFTSLIDMLEEKVSPDFADDVLEEAALENEGAFTSVGYYSFSEMQKLVNVLVEKTDTPANKLLYDFGYYLFGKLALTHSQVLAGRHNILDVLNCLDDDIHVQVSKLYPDADLPQFSVLTRTETSIALKYHSTRELYTLAEGLMDGAADHFENKIRREVVKLDEPHTYLFTITLEA